MPPRKSKKASLLSLRKTDGQLSNEQWDQKKQLFMQQFEKEAQERINEMEAQLEQILATVDRVFRVEIMKMPPQLQRTLIKDLMSEDDVPAGEVTLAMQVRIQKSIVKFKTVVPSSGKMLWASTQSSTSRFLSASNLVACGGDEKAGQQLVSPTATIFTSYGQTLCLSDDVKNDINVEMLDDTAVHQMQKLMQLMDYLCNKFSEQQPASGS
ncbi:borealin-2 [Megalops cyprinoides]|uniref:borealin-2 n=1 Tax=Megalops cyprinoides TaxID=118141 RepID=UPI001863E434|nr:borealin-2 [Megalops cyprinoides]